MEGIFFSSSECFNFKGIDVVMNSFLFLWNERNWVFVNDFFFYCALCGFLLEIKQKMISLKFFSFQSELSNHFMQIPSAFCSETIPVEYLYAVLCVFFILKLIHFSNFKQLMIII